MHAAQATMMRAEPTMTAVDAKTADRNEGSPIEHVARRSRTSHVARRTCGFFLIIYFNMGLRRTTCDVRRRSIRGDPPWFYFVLAAHIVVSVLGLDAFALYIVGSAAYIVGFAFDRDAYGA